jgi:hypothetical protein
MKNDSSVSGEYNISSTTESLSPHLEDLSPVSKEYYRQKQVI